MHVKTRMRDQQYGTSPRLSSRPTQAHDAARFKAGSVLAFLICAAPTNGPPGCL